jgi:hypothetical protein
MIMYILHNLMKKLQKNDFNIPIENNYINVQNHVVLKSFFFRKNTLYQHQGHLMHKFTVKNNFLTKQFV